MNLDSLCDDLRAERDDLFGYLGQVGQVGQVGDDWQIATPAPGWTAFD